MKVLHLIGGGDVGGAKMHVLSLVNELGKYIDVKIVSFLPGMFSDEASAMGINIEIVKRGNIFSDIKRVIAIAKEEGYQIIHSHGAKANMVSAIVRLFTNLPTVTTVHSDYRLDYLQSIYKRLSFGLINKTALRFINYYIGVSKNFKDMLVSRGFNPDNVFIVYNGMDFSSPVEEYQRQQFSKKYSLNLNDGDVVVGILARLHPVKGVGTFLQAAKEVVQHNPRVKFLIGGDGEDRKSLERKTAALGIGDNVFFLGFVNNPYEFMCNLDINVLTSISESFPYVILEGARVKKATISSDVGGISDLIESGNNGFLFTPGDHHTLAGYIMQLANDAGLREAFGNKLYEKAKAKFSLETMCRTQLDIYKSILGR